MSNAFDENWLDKTNSEERSVFTFFLFSNRSPFKKKDSTKIKTSVVTLHVAMLWAIYCGHIHNVLLQCIGAGAREAPREEDEGGVPQVRGGKPAHSQAGEPQHETLTTQTNVEKRLDEISSESHESENAGLQWEAVAATVWCYCQGYSLCSLKCCLNNSC